ncbi:MAG TPA: OmpH family outer membrane protein [Gammaproteobacteria bacterium]|nr:OmpH family outer membrane protein [Gammaproteobacteria bacterium]
MIKSSFIAALSLGVLATSAVNAQNTNLKVGVVNVEQLLAQAPQSKEVNDKLQTEFGPRQRDIAAKRQTLQTQSETFQRDAPVMGEEERLNLEREIRDGQRELQRTENEYLEDVNIRRNEELGKLQRALLQQVQAYARTEQYDLVVADVLYFSTAVDITAAVLAALQEESGGQ